MKKTRKTIISIFAALTAVSLILSGCGDSNSDNTGTSATSNSTVENEITHTTSGLEGTYYPGQNEHWPDFKNYRNLRIDIGNIQKQRGVIDPKLYVKVYKANGTVLFEDYVQYHADTAQFYVKTDTNLETISILIDKDYRGQPRVSARRKGQYTGVSILFSKEASKYYN